MTFGQRMKAARKEKNITQDDLATTVGTVREVIGKYERDETTPSIEAAAKIAEVLNCTLDYLVRGVTSQNGDDRISPQVQQRINILESLPSRDKEHIFAVIEAFYAQLTLKSSEKNH